MDQILLHFDIDEFYEAAAKIADVAKVDIGWVLGAVAVRRRLKALRLIELAQWHGYASVVANALIEWLISCDNVAVKDCIIARGAHVTPFVAARLPGLMARLSTPSLEVAALLPPAQTSLLFPWTERLVGGLREGCVGVDQVVVLRLLKRIADVDPGRLFNHDGDLQRYTYSAGQEGGDVVEQIRALVRRVKGKALVADPYDA